MPYGNDTFIGGIYGAKITHHKYNSKSDTKKSTFRSEPLLPATVPSMIMARVNSPSMNFQAAKGVQKFLLASELYIVAYDTWRSWNVQANFPVACSGSH